MAWPSYPSETSGPNGVVDATNDWNNARKLNTSWDSKALSTSTITVEGDGKYTVTYSGAQNLDTISGLSDGDLFYLKADVTGAGANLTIRDNQGNIQTPGDIDIVLSSDTDICQGFMVGSVVKVYAL
jgi:hypothetical protein